MFLRGLVALLTLLVLVSCAQMQKEPTASAFVDPVENQAVNDSVETLAASLQGQIGFPEIKSVFEHFIAKYPNSVWLHRDFQSLFDGYEQVQAKLDYYKSMYDANPNSAMANYLYARCLGGLEAAKLYQKAMELDGKFYWAPFGLASSLMTGNPPDTTKAIELYLKAIAIDNSNPMSFSQLTQIYLSRGDYANAIKFADLYATTSPKEYRPVAMKAEALENSGDAAGAKKALIAFSDANPDNGPVKRDLVEKLKREQRYAEALKFQHALVPLSRQPADAVVEIAKLHAMVNQPDSALVYLNNAAAQGYSDFRRLERNETLAPVRQLAGFGDLMGKLKSSAEQQRQSRLAPLLANADQARTMYVGGKLDIAAPTWAFSNLNGETVSLESLRGKVVVVDFWATWCGPCRMTMPLLQDFVERKADGVEFISMNVWEDDTTKVRPYLADYGYSFNVLFGDQQVAQNYQVTGIPTLVIIDKEGVIRYRHVGYDPVSDQVLLWQTEELLKKQTT